MTSGWHFHDDARDFLTEAAGYLAADPVELTVLTAWATREARQRDAGEWTAPDFDVWYAVHRSGLAIDAVAMRTAPFEPHPLWVPTMREDTARALGAAWVARGEVAQGGRYGVNGSGPAAAQCAEEVARACGGRIHVGMHTRLFRLDEVDWPARPTGGLRAVEPADHAWVTQWLERFHAEADEQSGRAPVVRTESVLNPEEVRMRIDDGRFWVFEVDGEPVHLTGVGRAAFGVARIGPVFTPQQHRGRGYAGWVVAELSARLLAEGDVPVLNTDQANPVSNGVYQSIGYTPVADHVQLLIR